MKIKNGLVFDPSHQMLAQDLCFENGIITETTSGAEYDATGCYVLPGLIDTHIHGACGVEFYASEYNGDIKPALDFLSAKGVTSILPTLAAETMDEYIYDCHRIASVKDDRILGIHCEGPFMNFTRKGGLHPSKLQTPNFDLPTLINEKSGGMLKILSMAPELEGAANVIAALTQKGIKVSMAHSDATYEEALAAVDSGASRATHLFNAMRPFSHRDPGILGCALTDERVECELICDLHHVSAPAIQLAVRSKGIDHITMISDGRFFCGIPEGTYTFNGRVLTISGGFARLPNGTISGSACSLADGVKNMFALGFKPEEIAIMACVNPARAAGCTDRGELQIGYRADVIILDQDFNVKSVFVKGKQIK